MFTLGLSEKVALWEDLSQEVTCAGDKGLLSAMREVIGNCALNRKENLARPQGQQPQHGRSLAVEKLCTLYEPAF